MGFAVGPNAVAGGGKTMTAANFITLFGIVAFFGVIVLLDWLGRRKDRHTKSSHQ
jgi:hypothetical protein